MAKIAYYKRPTSFSFLFPVDSSLSGPNILPSTLFSNTVNQRLEYSNFSSFSTADEKTEGSALNGSQHYHNLPKSILLLISC
jgi:hypothetical protein